MKEIGGFFGLEQFSGEEYHGDLLALNTGRNALAYLIRARQIKKLYIPAFLCDSVSKVCSREGCAYTYYSIDRDFMPVFDRTLEAGEYLYIVNFYGQLDNDCVKRLTDKYGRIIFDNIHAFYQRPVPGVDTLYSCRKFFGVPDGAYLATDALLQESLEKDVSRERMKHVLGRFEGCASDYHSDFKANDKSFVELPLREMSELTHNLLRAVDYEQVKNRRNENYAILAKALDSRNPLQPITPDGPYAYPLYCENGMEVKRQLAGKKIYIATLWPNVLECGSGLECDYTRNILPLPCDQRYGSQEMEFLIEEVLKCLN